MIVGTGIDIVEFQRIEKVIERQPRFISRILTSREQEIMSTLSKQRQLEYVSGRFAIKEAFAKAYGSGIGSKLNWKDVEVLQQPSGAPMVVCAKIDDSIHIHVSISHSNSHGIGQVILERR
ncbi:holo-[acyl-carrier protein] synthase [Geomicrobium halophilum]|uniref:Holo-[acyl-carrier-protein] synthase n=1 Tax=Geomicrobium halophilum TaxID=549000 RepID=A0A841PQV2_9BACL|nr:holo-ACP synthase [Geomicrobium halophilum]MBB6451267.1 holo-[acyl-carrier protein] synthase [Geomicrobium halophilum]